MATRVSELSIIVRNLLNELSTSDANFLYKSTIAPVLDYVLKLAYHTQHLYRNDHQQTAKTRTEDPESSAHPELGSQGNAFMLLSDRQCLDCSTVSKEEGNCVH